ncbi:MAG: membrane protein [Rhodospirillales bacterium]
MTSTALAFAPLVPLWLIWALGGVGLLLVALAAWRRARGWPLRGLAVALLLLGLANPSVIREERAGLPDQAVILVDESASQEVANRQGQTARALAHLETRLAALPDVETHVIRAGTQGEGTQLFTTLEETLADLPRGQVGGVFVISDGQVHDVPESLEQLAIAAPLHHLITGRPDASDRRLIVVEAPSFGIVGKEQSLTVRVEEQGGDGGLATLSISQDGGRVRSLPIPLGRDVEVPFTLERRGESLLLLEVSEGEQELSLENNRAVVAVNGVRDRLRVLLVSGVPHTGERVWRNILKSDPSVDLVHFTILRPPEKQDGTPIHELSLIAFPTRELFSIKLNEFDLIIFDRYRRRGVLPRLYLENIARYVEEGGALLESAGPASATNQSLYGTPLGAVMPLAPTGQVVERGYRPELTALGQRHPVTAGLSGANDEDGSPAEWGRWFRLVEAEQTSGQMLMEGPSGRPLLVLERIGAGRVAQLMSDQVWLWARGFEGGGPQAELLRRIAHWLMQEPDLEEEDLRARIEGETLLVERRSLSSESGTARVELPDGSQVDLALEESQPGLLSGRLAIEAPGLYRVEQAGFTTLAAAGPLNPLELADLRSSEALLAPLVEASGGGQIWLEETATPDLRQVTREGRQAGSNWVGLVRQERYRVTGVSEAALLPAWAYLLLALATALMAWRREGR